MRTKKIHFLIILITCSFSSFTLLKDQKDLNGHYLKAETIITSMIARVDSLQGLKFHLNGMERVKGAMVSSSSDVKLRMSIPSLYLKTSTGTEVLWVNKLLNGNVLVNPNSFPYLSMNLDPDGYFMRKSKHHSVHEVGFHYFCDVLNKFLIESQKRKIDYFHYQGISKWNETDCYLVSCDIKDFTIATYEVKADENILKIAKKNGLNEFMILELNPTANNYDDVKKGQMIKVPSAYAKTMTFLIDVKTLLPVNQKIYDDKGLFESYEYKNIVVDPTFSNMDFDKKNKEYHF